MARAFVGISHTPLMGLNPIAEGAERILHQALADLRATLDGAPVPLELDVRDGLARVRLEGGRDGRRVTLDVAAETALPGGSPSVEIPLRASGGLAAAHEDADAETRAETAESTSAVVV